jgi:hypothetical protein
LKTRFRRRTGALYHNAQPHGRAGRNAKGFEASAARCYLEGAVADLSRSLRAVVAVLLLDACSLLAPSDAELRGERVADAGPGGSTDAAALDDGGAADGRSPSLDATSGDAATGDASPPPSEAGAGADCAPLCAIVPPACVSDPCTCPTAPSCGTKTCTGAGAKITVTCDGLVCNVTSTTISCTDGTSLCHCL